MKTVFYYFDYSVRQSERGDYFIFCSEKQLNRRFSNYADNVVYCMAIANKANPSQANALADMVNTMLDKYYNQ